MSRSNARKRDRRRARQLREHRRKARARPSELEKRKGDLAEERMWAEGLVAKLDILYPGWFWNVDNAVYDNRMTVCEKMIGGTAARILGLEWLEGETSDPNFLIRSDKWEETIAKPEVAAERAAYRVELGTCDGCLESCEDLNPGGKCEPYYRTQGTPETERA